MMLSAALAVAFAFPGQPQPPVFVVESVHDERPRGAIARLAPAGAVQLVDGPTIYSADVIALRRLGAPPRLPHDRAHLLFANGDRIPGSLVSIENERVRFAADLGAPVEFGMPLSMLSAIWLSPRAAARAAQPAGRRALKSPRHQDTALLTNGDKLQGTIVSMPADGPLRIDTGGQTVDTPRDRLDALLFNSDLARVAKPRAPYRRLVLRNGARMGFTTSSADAQTLTGTTLFGATVRIPWVEIAALYTFGGAAIYLSDLKPLRYEPIAYLGIKWPFAADRNVDGGDLRLGGGTFDKGLGLHSACKLTFAVPPKCVRFEALAGLDEELGRRGAVVVQVRLDGNVMLSPELDLSGSDPPRELRLPLPPGSKELTIEIGFGRGGDVQDHVDLADARFVVDPRTDK
jgi:NPCBM/NEW2 domain